MCRAICDTHGFRRYLCRDVSRHVSTSKYAPLRPAIASRYAGRFISFRHQINNHQLRTIIYSRHSRGFPRQSATYDHLRTIPQIHATCQSGKQSMIGCFMSFRIKAVRIKPVENSGNAPNSAMRVTGQHQVKMILTIFLQKLRSMGQQNGVCPISGLNRDLRHLL